MARDKGLEEIISNDLVGVHDLSQKAMFGGWAWFMRGNLLCGARDDGMLVRLGEENERWALKISGVVPMLSRGKRMRGWVRVAPQACGDDALRIRLLKTALDFGESLPAK